MVRGGSDWSMSEAEVLSLTSHVVDGSRKYLGKD